MTYFLWAVVIALAIAISGCGAMSTLPPETRTITNIEKVPVAVPCFEEKDRPPAPVPTPVDLDNATTDQMAAAVAADNAADDLYMRQLEALFVQCQTSQGKVVK